MMLIRISESIAELHITWCGAPTNPYDPDHNPACVAAFQRLKETT